MDERESGERREEEGDAGGVGSEVGGRYNRSHFHLFFPADPFEFLSWVRMFSMIRNDFFALIEKCEIPIPTFFLRLS
jgi:hypothetical protein